VHDNKLGEELIHTCTACSCEFTDDEGGAVGDFGILPMAFCPTCLSCMYDMFDQQKEWSYLIKGVRVVGDDVVITVKGSNEKIRNNNARMLCNELVEEMNRCD